jgi:hypothetical protein
LIENNKNLILLLRLVDLCGIRGDVNGGRILPKVENKNKDGEYFRWWNKER